MKKLLAFILLLSHMNTSMFLPQVMEDDVYDSNGQQRDDINSVVEFIAVKLGYDHTPDDEDDDNGQNFHPVKVNDYSFQQPVIVLNILDPETSNNKEYPPYLEHKVSSPFFDIQSPPPDQA